MRTFLFEVALVVVDEDEGLCALVLACGVVVDEVSEAWGAFLFGHSFAEWFFPPQARHRPVFSIPSHECINGHRPARAQPLNVRPKNLHGTLDLSSPVRSPVSPSDFTVDCDEDREGAVGAVEGVEVDGTDRSAFIGLILGSTFGEGVVVVEDVAAMVEVETAMVSHSAKRWW